MRYQSQVDCKNLSFNQENPRDFESPQVLE